MMLWKVTLHLRDPAEETHNTKRQVKLQMTIVPKSQIMGRSLQLFQVSQKGPFSVFYWNNQDLTKGRHIMPLEPSFCSLKRPCFNCNYNTLHPRLHAWDNCNHAKMHSWEDDGPRVYKERAVPLKRWDSWLFLSFVFDVGLFCLTINRGRM